MENSKQISEWIDWELKSKEYLYNKHVIQKDYTDTNNHDHRELCLATFSVGEKGIKRGYYEPQSKSWICEECFRVFRDKFCWETNVGDGE